MWIVTSEKHRSEHRSRRSAWIKAATLFFLLYPGEFPKIEEEKE